MTDFEEYRATFKIIDSNGDGLISATELEQLMRSLGQEITAERAAEAVRTTDKDGDGQISLEEFAEWLRSTRPGA